MNRISGLVITLNEEENIEQCIFSLQKVCDDIVIVDSKSTDATVDIAKSLGVKVIIQEYLGDGGQRNFGLDFCKHRWVLNLDADERLEQDAIISIKELNLESERYDAYEFRRKNIFHEKWIKYTSWYPDNIRRLFNQEKTKFSEATGHTKIESTNYKVLKSHIIHYSYKDYSDMLSRLDIYSTRYAESNFDKKKANILTPVLHGGFAFFKNYIIKRGFIGGSLGLNISLLNALGSYLKYAKLLEKQNYSKGDKA